MPVSLERKFSGSLRIAFLAMALSGCQKECDRSEAGCNELANKHEYSVLQVAEADLRNEPHDVPYRRLTNEDGATVLAFPLAGQDRGYAVLLADAEVPPRDKVIPDRPFVVSADLAEELGRDPGLSPEAKKLIAQMSSLERSAD